MTTETRRNVRPAVALALALPFGLLATAGCGAGGPRTYPVRGRVALTAGDLSHLAGSHVEAALAGEPAVRASGEVQADGSFSLTTLHEGKVLQGARAGRYQARIVLNEDDPASRRRAAAVVPVRYREFVTAQMAIEVPSSGEILLTLQPR